MIVEPESVHWPVGQCGPLGLGNGPFMAAVSYNDMDRRTGPTGATDCLSLISRKQIPALYCAVVRSWVKRLPVYINNCFSIACL